VGIIISEGGKTNRRDGPLGYLINKFFIEEQHLLFIHKTKGVEMRIAKLITLLLVLSLALIGLNCEKSEEPASIPEKYIGTWEADSTLDGTLIGLAPADDPGQEVDFRDFGYNLKAVLNGDGNYSLTTNVPFFPIGGDQGKVSLDEEAKIITFISNDPESDPIIFFYEWEDDILVLTVRAPLDLGEGEEPYDITLKLAKTS